MVLVMQIFSYRRVDKRKSKRWRKWKLKMLKVENVALLTLVFDACCWRCVSGWYGRLLFAGVVC